MSRQRHFWFVPPNDRHFLYVPSWVRVTPNMRLWLLLMTAGKARPWILFYWPSDTGISNVRPLWLKAGWNAPLALIQYHVGYNICRQGMATCGRFSIQGRYAISDVRSLWWDTTFTTKLWICVQHFTFVHTQYMLMFSPLVLLGTRAWVSAR